MPPVTDTGQNLKHAAPSKRLRDAQERLLRDDADGDFTVLCGDRTWKCNARILTQRCEFFKAAISGSFKEAKAKTMKLDEETAEEVDMLLLHLYTLDDPDFSDKKRFKRTYNGAESALKLGDKYNLPYLAKAGRECIRSILEDHIKDWQSMTEETKQSWIRRLERLWNMSYREVNVLQRVAIERFVAVAKDIIAYEPFQKLCEEHPDFALMFMMIQAREADELRARIPRKLVAKELTMSAFFSSDPGQRSDRPPTRYRRDAFEKIV